MVGMLEPRKGHLVLFEAFQRIARRLEDVRLIVAGDEPPGCSGYRQILEADVAARGVGSRVLFLGHVEEIPALMAALDVVVLPVIQPEGFGRVVIEAYAARRPVVASRLGGLCEIVEDRLTGLLIPPRDASALTEAILDLLEDPAFRARLGEAGRRKAETSFNLEVLLAQLTRQYRHVLAGEG
jgi:glycosyltransferase involved in cell wall biosynthesis